MSTPCNIRDALALQFCWVNVLVRRRNGHYTSFARVRAALFASMHACFIVTLLFYFVFEPFSWVLAFLIQLILFIISVVHTALISEYEERLNNAMELERQLNPLIIAELTFRCFSLFHLFLLHWWFAFAVGLLEPLHNYWSYRRAHFLVDAATTWKQLGSLRTDARLRLMIQGLLLILTFAYLTLALLPN
ncbi:Cornichon protein [Trypanosoma brucei equiperdum]|uniref:Cornichon protein n=1 Tax=Trypanosoma brucei equiperdum TaxID=630700 RepID=A0A3L6KV84_9TRYP|nr:Cornichon protein [Trypanosoma brucei equiperdum]